MTFMVVPTPISKWQKIPAFVLALPFLIAGPLLAIVGMAAAIQPHASLQSLEERGVGIALLLAGIVVASVGCACLQVVAATTWSVPGEALRHRKMSTLGIVIGVLLAITGSAVFLFAPVIAIPTALAGIFVAANSLATRLTGLPGKAVFNALWKSTGKAATSQVMEFVNPIKFEVGGVTVQPELLEISPEFKTDGSLQVFHSPFLPERESLMTKEANPDD